MTDSEKLDNTLKAVKEVLEKYQDDSSKKALKQINEIIDSRKEGTN